MENQKIIYGGIVILMMVLSGGITFYLKDSGTKTSCSSGFQLITGGKYEGYYKCVTLSGERYELCYEVYNSSNTINYWCRKGILINPSFPVESSIGKYVCSPNGCVPVTNK